MCSRWNRPIPSAWVPREHGGTLQTPDNPDPAHSSSSTRSSGSIERVHVRSNEEKRVDWEDLARRNLEAATCITGMTRAERVAKPISVNEFNESEARVTCQCGKIVMKDSMFCRKCGTERPKERKEREEREERVVNPYIVEKVSNPYRVESLGSVVEALLGLGNRDP